MKKPDITDYKNGEDEHHDLSHLQVPGDNHNNRSPVVGHAG